MNWFFSIFSYFSIFFQVLFFVESVLLEETICRVCLIFSLVVRTFKWIWAWFTLLSLQSRGVYFIVSLATSHKFPVVNSLVGIVALNAFSPLNSTDFCWVAPFPTIFALQYARVYVGPTNCCNETSYIKPSIDNTFGFHPALRISDVNLDN